MIQYHLLSTGYPIHCSYLARLTKVTKVLNNHHGFCNSLWSLSFSDVSPHISHAPAKSSRGHCFSVFQMRRARDSMKVYWKPWYLYSNTECVEIYCEYIQLQKGDIRAQIHSTCDSCCCFVTEMSKLARQCLYKPGADIGILRVWFWS